MIPFAVVDTNVFVAAGFRPESDSGRLLSAVRRGAIRLVWNDETRAETERVVRGIPPLSGMVSSVAVGAASLFLPGHRHDVPASPDSLDAIPDPGDRKFAALARAAQAPLVSLDGHLLGAPDLPGLRILRPGEFLDGVGVSRGA